MTAEVHPPIRRLLATTAVKANGTTVVIEADEAERAALAAAAGALSVEAFRAELRVAPWSGSGFSVAGRVAARLTLACVVSLEPVASTVDEPVDVHLVPPEELSKWAEPVDEAGAIDLDVSRLDVPDPLDGDEIDLGAIAVEYFLIGVDPYPRKPGAVFDADAAGVGEAPESFSPFAALAQRRKE
jgi:hypothetical protein